MEDRLAYCCPRCGGDVLERFYGPCGQCRVSLAASQGSDTRAVSAAARFEPRMHVVPNHVATKD